MNNPFYVGKQFDPDMFIERDETGEVMKLIDSRSNFILFAPRRCGKTWFGRYLQGRLKAEKVDSIWIDLFSIVTVKQFVQRINEEIIREFRFNPRNYFRSFFDNYSASFSISLNSAEVNFSPRNQEEVYEILGRTIGNLGRISSGRLVVFIDEIQEITKFGDNFINVLRSYIQDQKVTYVFMGSKRSVINELFFSNKNPMFRMFRKLELSARLPEEKTKRFIKERFERTDKAIDDEAIGEIVNRSRLHPYYVQLICSDLWMNCDRAATVADVGKSVDRLIDENTFLYQSMIEGVKSKYALVVLKMILAGELTYNASNLVKWGLRSPASLSQILKKLETEEIIVKKGRYHIYDPLFEEYLKRL